MKKSRVLLIVVCIIIGLSLADITGSHFLRNDPLFALVLFLVCLIVAFLSYRFNN